MTILPNKYSKYTMTMSAQTWQDILPNKYSKYTMTMSAQTWQDILIYPSFLYKYTLD